MNRQEVGRTGERIAEQYLCKQGYQIITVNYHALGGELDIIALRRRVLVFVEVKTKSSAFRGTPASQLTGAKIAALRRTAAFFKKAIGYGGKVRAKLFGIEMRRVYRSVRFDLIEVMLDGGKAKCLVHTKNVITER